MSTTLTVPIRVAPRRVIYIGLSGLMGLMAIVGFWPKYFGPLVLGTLVQPLLIHVHATVFTGWLVLFFLQAYFAATNRIQLHLTLGRVGIWYGVMLIVVGLTTGVMRSSASPPGRAEALLLAIIEDMLMFAGFFGVAIWYRKRPKVHRPAMVVATTSLLVAAVARMTFVPPGASRLAIWSMPILIAAAVDFRQTRSIHPVYLIGLSVCVVRIFNVSIIASTGAWGSFAHRVFGVVL
jgi:hypothetical protein